MQLTKEQLAGRSLGASLMNSQRPALSYYSTKYPPLLCQNLIKQ